MTLLEADCKLCRAAFLAEHRHECVQCLLLADMLSVCHGSHVFIGHIFQESTDLAVSTLLFAQLTSEQTSINNQDSFSISNWIQWQERVKNITISRLHTSTEGPRKQMPLCSRECVVLSIVDFERMRTTFSY